jgi:hypothetical protein
MAVFGTVSDQRAKSIRGWLQFVGGGLVIAAATAYLVSKVATHKIDHASAYWGWFGVVAVGALWLIGGTLASNFNPLSFAMGADNRLSTSKLQVLLWTATIGFVYVMFYADRAVWKNDFSPLTDIPSNVLVVLGISVTTAVAAQAITGSQASANPDTKTAKAEPSYDPSALVRNDDGATPSLTKIQLLFWTVVAVVIYLITSFHQLANITSCGDTKVTPIVPCFPDIDTTLMIFMGLGHATYVGGKLASPAQPALTSATGAPPAAGAAGRVVTILGTNLGLATGSISMNGTTISPSNLTWAPEKIVFDLPATNGGAAWAAGSTAVFVVTTAAGVASGPIAYKYA